MNGYLLSVIGAVLISAILTAVLPNGKSSGIIKTVLKLACILIIISPVLEYIKYEKNPQKNTENSVIQTDSEFINYYSELRIENATAQIEKELYAKFSLSIHVELEWSIEKADSYLFYDDEAIKISCIRIQMPSAVEKEVKKQVFQYVKDNYCSEVLIE